MTYNENKSCQQMYQTTATITAKAISKQISNVQMRASIRCDWWGDQTQPHACTLTHCVCGKRLWCTFDMFYGDCVSTVLNRECKNLVVFYFGVGLYEHLVFTFSRD